MRSLLVLLLLTGLSKPVVAQTYPFNSGPIPLCATSTFTANVSGIGTLVPPWNSGGGYTLSELTMNITSDHPQTLQITLTSPEGTELLLSEFNGAGGQNYTNTSFGYSGFPSITTGTAPFTGWFTAQGGGFDVFDWENADGTWTITVTDTACANGGTGPGGTWTPGWFDGAASGGFAFSFTPPPPPCWGFIPSDVAYICSGAAVDLQGYYTNFMPGYMYTFTGPNWAPVPDPTAVTIPGQYWIDAMDPWDGCMYTATYDVVFSNPASLGPDQVVDQCDSDGPVDLTALFTMSGGTPMWSVDGMPIANATAMQATDPGLYRLIEENPGGCNDTAFVELNITAGPVLGADQSVNTCPDGSVDLTALYNTSGFSASWTFGGVPFMTPEAATDAGVYSLTVTAAGGCSDLADVTLGVDAGLALGADQAHDLCDNASLDLTALYNTAGSTAEWTYFGAPILTPGTVYQGGTYQLVVSSPGGGCTDTALVVVTLNLGPDLGPDLIDNTCENEAADLTVFFPTTGLSTSWTLSGDPVPDPTAVFDAGLYMLIATDANGCADTARTEIVVDPVPVIGPDQSITSCTGVGVDLTALYATGSHTTAWTQGGTAVADPTSAMDAGAYSLTVTTAAQCVATAVVTVVLDPAPTLGADEVASSCSGTSFDLTQLYSTTGLDASWTLEGVAVTDPAIVDVSGDYRLVAVNGSGCTDTAMVALTMNTAPDLGADLSFPLCPWQTVDLSTVFPIAGMIASYTLDGQSLDDPTAVYDPGTYGISVVDANGCADEALAVVTNIECLCEAEFMDDADCFQESVQFTLVADSTVLSAHWDFDGAASNSTAIDPVVGFSADGEIRVTLQATLSCGVVEVQRVITLQDCTTLCNVWIPSSFTPNNDTWNDTWNCTGACEPEDFFVEVYDRFGEVIFASKDPQSGWDGTYSGGLSPTGVYTYRVGYVLPYQKRKEVTGSITLVR
ncbi:MAG: T9SS type B sorting domain-containing protein [Flavobacteriales bacterium]|nr:T9SS type B sorting domain-containing protein [Flavobacteriales bacterium]